MANCENFEGYNFHCEPDGAIQKEIALKGKEPTNLAFGGVDGKTVFVMQRQGGFIELFLTDQEAREHCLQKASCARASQLP